MRAITEIIVHCSATRPEWMAGHDVNAKRDEIRRWHLDRGWRDIGYHAVIDRDGSIATGRDTDHDGDVWEEIGAHVAGRNSTTLGVCLLGGHGSNENDQFADNFTPEQDAALRKWIAARRAEFPSIAKVSGHNEYAAKACPGFQVGAWLAGGRRIFTAPMPAPEPSVPDEVRRVIEDGAKSWTGSATIRNSIKQALGAPLLGVGAWLSAQPGQTQAIAVGLLAIGVAAALWGFWRVVSERLRKSREAQQAVKALSPTPDISALLSDPAVIAALRKALQ